MRYAKWRSISPCPGNRGRYTQTTYTRDLVGNVIQLNQSANGPLYGYDALNRLTSISIPGDPVYRAFTYDLVGNRKTETSNEGTRHFLYGPANRLQEVRDGSETGPLVASFVYDDNGAVVEKKDALGITLYAPGTIGARSSSLLVPRSRRPMVSTRWDFACERRRRVASSSISSKGSTSRRSMTISEV